MLGHLYENGLSVDKNIPAAFECFKKAADLGCRKSNTKVGHYLYSGIRQHSYGELNLEDVDHLSTEEDISLLGTGADRYHILPDRRMALRRYLKSSRMGDPEACNCAGLILEQDNPIDAVELYKRGLELDQNNTDIMVNMALLYYNKREEQEWHFEAIKMMRRASALGNERATEYLEDRGLMSQENNYFGEEGQAVGHINVDRLEQSLDGSATQMFERAIAKQPSNDRNRAVSFKTNVSRKSGRSVKTHIKSDSLVGSAEDDEISYSLSQSAASRLEEQSWNLTATERDININGKFGR